MPGTFDQQPEDWQMRAMRDAAAGALASWKLGDAALELIKYRENAVFSVAAGDERYALRVHRHGYHDRASLRSELLWIDALGKAAIDVPRVVPAADGALLVSVPCRGLSESVHVDLFEWIGGEQLGSVEDGVAMAGHRVDETYRTIGRLAARVHNQAADWRPPAGFTRPAWDEDGLAGKAPLWGRFWELPSLDSEQRQLLTRARERVYRDLAALDKLPRNYSLIHADFAPENLLVEGDRVRLIDFDDAGYGWHLFELVTSLYFVMGEDYFGQARDALIAGYRLERPLPDEVLARLPLFFLARACTYVGWVHTRPGTRTALELTPMLVDGACTLAEAYLND